MFRFWKNKDHYEYVELIEKAPSDSEKKEKLCKDIEEIFCPVLSFNSDNGDRYLSWIIDSIEKIVSIEYNRLIIQSYIGEECKIPSKTLDWNCKYLMALEYNKLSSLYLILCGEIGHKKKPTEYNIVLNTEECELMAKEIGSQIPIKLM